MIDALFLKLKKKGGGGTPSMSLIRENSDEGFNPPYKQWVKYG